MIKTVEEIRAVYGRLGPGESPIPAAVRFDIMVLLGEIDTLRDTLARWLIETRDALEASAREGESSAKVAERFSRAVNQAIAVAKGGDPSV